MENWAPIKFGAEVEDLYAKDLQARFLPLSRLAYLIGAIAFLGYAAWDLMLDPNALDRTGAIRIAAVLHFLFALCLTFLPVVRRSPWGYLGLSLYTYLGVAILFGMIVTQLPGGTVAGVSGFLLGVVFVPAITNGVAQAALMMGPYYIAALLTIFLNGATRFEVINVAAWLGGAIGFALGFAYLLDVINRRAFDLQRRLDIEKRRSEALVLNILPVDIARRLKENEEPLADAHQSVSVLFADLAGFTDMARKMSPEDVVNLLNDLFSRFDELANRFGAEKIKTIGDAYMLATGLHGSVADHAERISELALSMQRTFGEFCRDNGVDLKLRIGVHSGAVVAGVIGKQKFSYDLWGDTVNIASRMESEGIPGCVQISEETRQLLSDRFRTSLRGEIRIKGHRPRSSYLLEGLV